MAILDVTIVSVVLPKIATALCYGEMTCLERGDNMDTLQDKRVIVTGGSRGFGRGIVETLLGAGAWVHVVARDAAALAVLRAELGERVSVTAADAADPMVIGHLLDTVHPDVIVLSAGASPLPRPLHHHTWESFSANWNVDVKMTFSWLREALLLPLPPGSAMVLVSSGAALTGSSLSGGYAGAKATIRFMAEYAAEESHRGGLGIQVTALLPRLGPATGVGGPTIAAGARRAGVSEEAYLAQFGVSSTPELVGEAVLQVLTDPELGSHRAVLLTATGLAPVDGPLAPRVG
jgi:NAD(P)-dependent dehydrogenase (short-subunit alcohol dehydrogenase family)